MSVNFQLDAIVLHSREMGEKDVLLTVLSKERGKLTFICKGVKKPLSRLRSSAQLFSHARFFLYEGKSLPVATQSDLIESFRTIATDIEKFAVASYFTELVELLLPERELNFKAYLLLQKTLRLLDEEEGVSWSLFLAFQIKIFVLAGYEPQIEVCASCEGALSKQKYLSPALGGTVCKNCAQDLKQVQEGTIQSLRFLKQTPLEKVVKLKIGKTIIREQIKFLKNYIEYHAEHKLRSAEFLHSLA